MINSVINFIGVLTLIWRLTGHSERALHVFKQPKYQLISNWIRKIYRSHDEWSLNNLKFTVSFDSMTLNELRIYSRTIANRIIIYDYLSLTTIVDDVYHIQRIMISIWTKSKIVDYTKFNEFNLQWIHTVYTVVHHEQNLY